MQTRPNHTNLEQCSQARAARTDFGIIPSFHLLQCKCMKHETLCAVLEDLPRVCRACAEEHPETFRNRAILRTVLWQSSGGAGAPSRRRSGMSQCVWCVMTGNVPLLEVPRNSLKRKSWTSLADSKELLPLKKSGLFFSLFKV